MEYDVCQCEKQDRHLLNGVMNKVHLTPLFKVYAGKTANISLCYFHSVELFKYGERRFLLAHRPLMHLLAEQISKSTSTFY